MIAPDDHAPADGPGRSEQRRPGGRHPERDLERAAPGDQARPRRRTGIRCIGLAILGLVGGLLAGIVVQDLIAPLLITGTGEVSTVGLVLLPLLIPVCGAVGAVIAVLLNIRARR